MNHVKKIICSGLGLITALSLLPLQKRSLQAEERPAKLEIAAVYGGAVSEKGKTAKKGSVSHSFIEIYNPNEEPVSLKDYSLYYQGFPSQFKDKREGEYWARLALDENTELPGFCSYLINAGETAAGPSAALQLQDFDQVWEDPPALVTKGGKYLLTYKTEKVPASLVNPFDIDGNGTKIPGYIDMFGHAGNDDGENDSIDGCETAFPGGDANGSSKQKGYVRLARGNDSDNNAADFRLVDFREESDPLFLPRSLADGPLETSEGTSSESSETSDAGTETSPESTSTETAAESETTTTVTTETTASETTESAETSETTAASETTESAETSETTAASETTESTEEESEAEGHIPDSPSRLPGSVLTYRGAYSVGTADADGGVAEIVKYNSDNQKMYVVSGSIQCVDIVDLSEIASGQTTLETRIDMAAMGSAHGFSAGDITSVDVNTELDLVALAVQDADFREAGSIVFTDYDGNYLSHVACGVQPDMIGFSPDGRYVLTADEGEPRNGYGDVDPEGTVTVVDLSTVQAGGRIEDLPASAVTKAGFAPFDGQSFDPYVLLKEDSLPSLDFEPEYIAFAEDSQTAYVSLQENNAIAVLDLPSASFSAVHGIPFKDHSLPENALDLNKDGIINIVPEDVYGVPMPDGIAAVSIDGKTYVLTANEGDAREWGDYENTEKKTINGSAKKVECLRPDSASALDPEKTYLLGARSFSILDPAAGMSLVYDSGSDFESVTARSLPSIFNANHKNNKLEGRSNKKGPEPEDVSVLKHDGRVYAFITLERIGGVMMYDVTTPAESFFVDYVNQRDPSVDGLSAGHLGAEGVDTVEASLSPHGKAMVLVANEVSGTVMILDFGEAVTPAETTETSTEEATPGESETTAPETSETTPEASETPPETSETSPKTSETESSLTTPEETTAASEKSTVSESVSEKETKADKSPSSPSSEKDQDLSKTGASAAGIMTGLALLALAVILLIRRQRMKGQKF